MTYTDTILADSPTAYIKLDGSVENLGSVEFPAGFNSTPTSYTDGIDGQAGYFNNRMIFSYNSPPYSDELGDRFGISIEGWVRTTNSGARRNIFGTGGATNNGNGIFFSLETNGTVAVRGPGSTSTYMNSSSTINDGVWHHLVATFDGSTMRLYVDGTLRSSAGRSTTGGNAMESRVRIGGANDGTNFIGDIDEVAVYHEVLTSSQIENHYNAAFGTSIEVDVDRADMVTLSSSEVTIPNVDVSSTLATVQVSAHPIALDVDAANASLNIESYDAEVGATRSDVTFPTSDYRVHITSGTREQADMSTITPTGSTFYGAVFEVDTPSGATVTNTDSVEFSFHVDSMAGGTAGWVAYPIVAPPVENLPIQTGPGVNFNITLEWNIVDLTSVIDVSNFHGVMLAPQQSGAAGPAISSIEGSSPASLITLWEPRNEGVEVDTDLTTLSINAYEADVYVDAEVEVDTLELSAFAYEADAESSVTPDAFVDTTTALLTFESNEAEVLIYTAVEAERGVLSTESYDADVELTLGADVEVSQADAVFTEAKRPESVNDIPVVPSENEDPYFVTTWDHLSRSMNPSAWFRMNEQPGEKPVDRTGTWNNSTYEGVELGLVGGPDGRTFARFNGDSVFYQNDDVNFDDEFYDRTGTLEFTIRTTKKDQFVLRMDDAMRGTSGAITNTLSRDIYLEDGKINMRSWDFVPATPNARQIVEFTGFTDIADGNWHHIVLASSLDPRDGSTGYGRVNVYIDGKLEIRRNATGISFPDFIGMRPVYQWEEYGPETEWFEGDLTEVVFYNGLFLTQDGVFRQYDGVNGFRPLRPARARATAKAHDVKVETNTKLVLTINFGATYQGRTPTLTMQDPNSDRYWSNAGPVDVNFNFSGLAYGATETQSVIQNNYQFFEMGIKDVKDVVSDEYRLLDLDKDDIDIEKYDIINVINFPQSAQDWLVYEFYDTTGINFHGRNGRQQVEHLALQIRDLARLDGKGLFITDPAFAAIVGVIGRYEFVPHLREPRRNYNRGNSLGTYDYRSAIINPWGHHYDEPIGGWSARPGQAPVPDFNYEEAANFYHDDHSNTRQRVVKTVPGLTDIPGHILVDSFSYDPWRDKGKQWAEKYEDRPEGLYVDDEFWIMGTQGGGRGGDWDLDPMTGGLLSPWMRGMGFVATRTDDILAGSAVTTFARTIWVDKEEIPNPYSGYALSIVVEQGDLWNGIPSRGKVYVNFTEAYADLAHTPARGVRDLVPEIEPRETEESREWDWSSYRGTWTGMEGQGLGQQGKTVTIKNASGTTTTVTISDDDFKEIMVGIKYTARWEQELFPVPQMHYRGLSWLASEVDDSVETVGVAAARLTIGTKEAVVESKRSTEVDLGTARLNIEAGRMEDVEYADSSVSVQTARMTTKVEPFAEIVEPDVATLSIRSGQDIEGDWQEAELVVLKINDSQIIMRMEDDF